MIIHHKYNTRPKMPDFLIDFEWQKDSKGYELVSVAPSKPSAVARRKAGGKLLSYRPMDKFPTLYGEFARIKTPEDVVSFCNRFGPLTNLGLSPTKGKSISQVLVAAEVFRRLLTFSQNHRKLLAAEFRCEGATIGTLIVSLVGDEITGALRLRIVPRSMLDALTLQLAQKISGNIKARTCQYCSQWFEAGSGTGRRFDAKFCCDEHRVLYNSLKRSKEK